MPRRIEGVEYYLLTEVLAMLEVSRTTLWRWRDQAKIPQGHLLRGRKILFTKGDVEAIREFAHRVEPIAGEPVDQLPLFHLPHR